MTICFLDCDGVLNGIRNWPPNAGRDWIDPKTVVRLNKLTKRTGASLVISSTWRRFWDVPAILRKAGITAPILGETPYLKSMSRGCEIKTWLAEHGEVKKFIILDDDSDMDDLTDHLVQTEWDLGLQDKHIEDAIRKLR